jgi:hypothetical protein
MSAFDEERLYRAEFTCEAPGASAVVLMFDDVDIRPIPMTDNGGGNWTALLMLPPGQHRYKYAAVYHGTANIRDEEHCGVVTHLSERFRARPVPVG